MSRCFEIACKKCKISLWIGQGWNKEDFTIYSRNKECMGKLKDFLFEHMGHSLIFDEDQKLEDEDYEKIEWG